MYGFDEAGDRDSAEVYDMRTRHARKSLPKVYVAGKDIYGTILCY